MKTYSSANPGSNSTSKSDVDAVTDLQVQLNFISPIRIGIFTKNLNPFAKIHYVPFAKIHYVPFAKIHYVSYYEMYQMLQFILLNLKIYSDLVKDLSDLVNLPFLMKNTTISKSFVKSKSIAHTTVLQKFSPSWSQLKTRETSVYSSHENPVPEVRFN